MTKRRSGQASVAVMVLVLALLGGACSGDDGGDEPTGTSRPEPAQVDRQVPMQASAGKVTGKMSKKVRKRTAARIGRKVNRWFVAAWIGGDHPRKKIAQAWPGFTKDLAERARKDKALTTNAKLVARIDGVHLRRRSAKVDLLAAGGRPVGATARFRLVFDTEGKVKRRVRVIGQLSLTPVKAGWKIFGYDMSRSVQAVPKSRKKATDKKSDKEE